MEKGEANRLPFFALPYTSFFFFNFLYNSFQVSFVLFPTTSFCVFES